MIEPGFLITAFATLFVVIDPPGLVPLFIALTQGMDNERRRAMALRACIIATVLLLLFGLAGETVPITIPGEKRGLLDKIFARRAA